MVTIKSDREVELMRKAGEILAEVHLAVADAVKSGISTADLDRLCEKTIRSFGCIPSFKNYEGFPASACISVNEEVVHGIPSED
ncbi:MAG: M24 family metallopeptidase, partial [Lachnospiraceae bacterium]|nr:M24 family metallopeptidase [Lachnospiraceae bacterium]